MPPKEIFLFALIMKKQQEEAEKQRTEEQLKRYTMDQLGSLVCNSGPRKSPPQPFLTISQLDPCFSRKIEDWAPIIDTDGLMYLCELLEHLLMSLPKPKQLGKRQARHWGDAFQKRAQAQLNHKTCDAQEANNIAAALVLFEACKKPVDSHVMNLGVYLVHFETLLTHAFDALSALGATQTLLTQNKD